MKSILTSPPAIEPVSLAEVKMHLRIDGEAEDALLAKLIGAARRHVEAATGLALIAQSWSIFLDRWPAGPIVELPAAPLAAIEKVRVYGEDDAASTLDPAHYYADTLMRQARLVLRRERWWPLPGRAANGIEIKVLAGYGEEPGDVPEGLRLAILRLVACWFENRGDDGLAPRVPLGIDPLLQPFREILL